MISCAEPIGCSCLPPPPAPNDPNSSQGLEPYSFNHPSHPLGYNKITAIFYPAKELKFQKNFVTGNFVMERCDAHRLSWHAEKMKFKYAYQQTILQLILKFLLESCIK